MRASGLQMLLALCRLPMIGWHLGRAGTLGHLARVSMLPIWMRRICRLADMMVRSRSARSDAGAALAEALIRLGPGFIKFGQALSTRSDLIGPEMALSLSQLQDRLPPFSSRLAQAQIETELGASLDSVFSDFNPKPVAAASIAQVHKAALKAVSYTHLTLPTILLV